MSAGIRTAKQSDEEYFWQHIPSSHMLGTGSKIREGRRMLILEMKSYQSMVFSFFLTGQHAHNVTLWVYNRYCGSCCCPWQYARIKYIQFLQICSFWLLSQSRSTFTAPYLRFVELIHVNDMFFQSCKALQRNKFSQKDDFVTKKISTVKNWKLRKICDF